MNKRYLTPSGPIWTGWLPATPIGPVSLAVSEQGLVRIEFCSLDELKSQLDPGTIVDKNPPPYLETALQQLDAYFRGQCRTFDLPIDWRVMPDFQAQALRITLAIPFGRVRTYGDIARQMGKPNAARAVGGAEAHNPLPILIPCHRVVDGQGGLHGYGAPGGINTKKWLLELEGHAFIGQRMVMQPMLL
jgi:methylated-DNA-[protein]-cysteine S-methyltransferase